MTLDQKTVFEWPKPGLVHLGHDFLINLKYNIHWDKPWDKLLQLGTKSS